MNTAADEGRFAALLFIQSINDHGHAMSSEEVGAALADVCTDLRNRAKDSSAEVDEFLRALGEHLWWQAHGRVLSREETAGVVLGAIRRGLLGEGADEGGAHGRG
jgi:hypothetical protein